MSAAQIIAGIPGTEIAIREHAQGGVDNRRNFLLAKRKTDADIRLNADQLKGMLHQAAVAQVNKQMEEDHRHAEFLAVMDAKQKYESQVKTRQEIVEADNATAANHEATKLPATLGANLDLSGLTYTRPGTAPLRQVYDWGKSAGAPAFREEDTYPGASLSGAEDGVTQAAAQTKADRVDVINQTVKRVQSRAHPGTPNRGAGVK